MPVQRYRAALSLAQRNSPRWQSASAPESFRDAWTEGAGLTVLEFPFRRCHFCLLRQTVRRSDIHAFRRKRPGQYRRRWQSWAGNVLSSSNGKKDAGSNSQSGAIRPLLFIRPELSVWRGLFILTGEYRWRKMSAENGGFSTQPQSTSGRHGPCGGPGTYSPVWQRAIHPALIY